MSDTSSRDTARDAMAAALSTERIDGDESVWTRRLVLFLRIMAMLSIIKGLYHWAQVTGFVGGEEEAFENQPMAWQAATVYFAVIELDAMGCRGVAHHRGVDGRHRADVSRNLWRQPDRRRNRGIHAGCLSCAGLDGGARTPAVAHRPERACPALG